MARHNSLEKKSIALKKVTFLNARFLLLSEAAALWRGRLRVTPAIVASAAESARSTDAPHRSW